MSENYATFIETLSSGISSPAKMVPETAQRAVSTMVLRQSGARAVRISAWFLISILCLATLAPRAWAQQPDDPLRDSLFPPELVMQHQQAIGLSDEQKNFFKAELRQAQLHFTELQWKVQDEMEKLLAMIKQARIDEQQATAQLEKVLGVERDIKRTQLTLMIRLKNKLTPEQQSRLQELRNKPAGKRE